MSSAELGTLNSLYRVHKRPCDACRTRKSKCVREYADYKCRGCTDRNIECLYVLPPVKKKRKLANESETIEPRVDATVSTITPDTLERVSPIVTGNSFVEDQPKPPPECTIYKRQYLMGGNNDFDETIFVDVISFDSVALLPANSDATINRLVNKLLKDAVFVEVREDETKCESRKKKLDQIHGLVGSCASKLVSLYFRTVHSSFPILNKEEFIKTYNTDFYTISPALLASLYLFALNWWSLDLDLSMLTPPSQKELEIIAEECLMVEMNCASVATVQAGLLLIQHQSFRDNYENPIQSYAMQASITALGHGLGLNRNPDDWNIPSWEKSLRKRISWALYVQDKWLSLALDLPSHITIYDWSVDELDENLDFQDLTATSSTPIQGVIDTNSGRVLFLQTIELSKIVDQILTSLYSITGKDYIKSLEVQDPSSHLKALLDYIKPLQVALVNWEAQLPNVLNIELNPRRGHISSTPNIYIANFTAKVIILRPVLRAIAAAKQKKKPVNDQFMKIRDIVFTNCILNLENSVRFLGEMKAEHFQTFWYTSAKSGFSFLVVFGHLIRLISQSQEEFDKCSDRLEELIWKLKINSKNAEFLRHSILWWHQLATLCKNHNEDIFKEFTLDKTNLKVALPKASVKPPQRDMGISPDFITYLSPRLNNFDILEKYFLGTS